MQVANKRTLVAVLFSLFLIAPLLYAEDWPTWRYDAARTGASPGQLPPALYLQWVRQYAPPQPAWPEDERLLFDASYEPIVQGETLYLASAQNDSITAIDTRSGAEKWQFFAEGPIRFAPVAHDGNIYFGADDGSIYCLSAANGDLLWKLDIAQDARKVIGNDRMVSILPIRGGPVLADDKLYFTAGVWPFEGTFLYMLDLQKVGQGTLPSNAYEAVALTNMTPQGYLAESGGKLFIPCGRAKAALFDTKKGALQALNYSSTGLTDYFVTASDRWLFHGHRVIDLASREMLPINAPRPVTDGSEFYIAQGENIVAADILKQPKPEKKEGAPQQPPKFKASWHVTAQDIRAALGGVSAARLSEGSLTVDIKAGSRVYGRYGNAIYAADAPEGDKPAQVSWATVVEGNPTSLSAADDRLFVTTQEGKIFCYGGTSGVVTFYPAAEGNFGSSDSPIAGLEDVIETLPDPNGYCLLWGTGDGKVIEQLLAQSNLQIIVVESDPQKISAIRKMANAKGMYGSRLTALLGDPIGLRLPPYFANLLVVADQHISKSLEKSETLEGLYEMLHPYGGTAIFPTSEAQQTTLLASTEKLPQAQLQRSARASLLRREGALEGAANWSHEYGDPSNSLMSQDQRVQLPLGVLWFGGPASDTRFFFDRHFWGPSLTVIDGRMFLQGHTTLAAVDIYTGKILWEKTIKQGSSPGRRGNFYDGDHHTGYHFCAVEGSIYLTYPESCLRIDPRTGETLAEFRLPESTARWGRIRVWNDLLIASIFDTAKHEGSVPTRLVALDRKTGKIVWDHAPEASCPTVAIGNDRVYYFDGHIKALYNDIGRGGVVPKTGEQRTLRALDAATGDEIWSQETPMVVTWIAYKQDQDILVASNHEQIQARRGETGEAMWDKTAKSKGFHGHPESRWDRVILWKDRIIDQRGPGVQYFLETGEPIQMRHPISGQPVNWEFTAHGHHCNYAIANEHMMTFRADTAGFTDMKNVTTGRLSGFRTGCRNSLIPAGGVLNAPNFGHGCTCAYSLFTSLALIHIPEMDSWRYSAMTAPTGPVSRVGINLAAPGDRESESGTMWLDYPQPGEHNFHLPNISGPSPDVPVTIVASDPDWFRQHPAHLEGEGERWVAASGGEGLDSLTISLGEGVREDRAYRVRLYFSEPNDLAPGDRLFNVSIEGKPVLEQFDVVKEAGGRKRVLIKEFHPIAAGKSLRIDLEPVAGKTLLSGVEVIATED